MCPALHPLQLFLERIAAFAKAMLADEGWPMLVTAQVANSAHVFGALERLHEPHTVAVRARKRIQLARPRRWTRDDRVSLRLAHYSANISVATTVDV